jgi:hypothetical protein
VNLCATLDNNPIDATDWLGLVPALPDRITDIVSRAGTAAPRPATGKECFFVVFYDTDKPRLRHWEENADNNWITHAAIQVGAKTPVGFNPPEKIAGSKKRIFSELRTDVALIVRCCTCTATQLQDMASFLDKHRGARDYNGQDWDTNGPNCATFVVDAVQKGGGLPAGVKWDKNLIGTGDAHRPEEVRRALIAQPGCETIYTNPAWKGKP